MNFTQIPFPWTTASSDGSHGSIFAANGQQIAQIQQIPLEPRQFGAGEVAYRVELASWVSKACNSHNDLVEALVEARNALEVMAKDTTSTATGLQNKAVTGYMRTREALVKLGYGQ